MRAKWTVVYDRELADFPWADDGTPCMALVFSTWFSRGWTALELFMSKNVCVIFRNPAGPGYVLKDLDRDIVACEYDPFAHPAHKVISTIIGRFRPTNEIF